MNLSVKRLTYLLAVAAICSTGLTQEFLILPQKQKPPNEQVLILRFENDIFTKTDRYFSNGISVDYYNTKLQINLFNRLLRTSNKELNQYSWTLRQNMYTPTSLGNSQIQENDRPYAGFIIGTYRKESYSEKKKHKAELSLGILGKYSGNEFTQNFVHQFGNNSHVEGWQNQLSNAPVVNLQYGFDYLFYQTNYSDLSSGVELRLGTLFTDVNLHVQLQLGKLNRTFSNTGPLKNLNKKSYFSMNVYIEPMIKLVVYDATLQGGIASLNPGIYTLNDAQIERLVFNWKAGMNFQIYQFAFLIGFQGHSPDFIGSEPHKWGEIAISYSF